MVKGKDNWEGDYTVSNKCPMAPDAAPMTDLRNDLTHIKFAKPARSLVVMRVLVRGYVQEHG